MIKYKDEIPLVDIAIFEIHKKNVTTYGLSISLFNGGSISFGDEYDTKTKARIALRRIKLHSINFLEGMGILRICLHHLQRVRISPRDMSFLY